MLTLVWLGIVAIAIGALMLVLWYQQQQNIPIAPPTANQIPLKRGFFTLQLGDIVQYEGIDWVVEERLSYEEEGDVWFDYLLQDQDTIRWLSVEEGDRVEICWMETITDLEVSHQPPAQLTYQGLTYRRRESGVALMTKLDSHASHHSVTCHYTDYTASNQHILSVERWNGDVEITVGKQIPASALVLLPGDGHRVYND